ncbi:MAG: CBS domain-containing protein, partial [Myxococcota bacterium]
KDVLLHALRGCAPEALVLILEHYKANRRKDELFSEYFERVGKDPFEELLVGEDISGAAVVGSEGQVVGVASKTDIVRALGDEQPRLSRDLDESLTVADIMTRDIFTIRPDAEVSEVAQQMIDGRIHRVFVCDGDELLGIITPFDLLRLLV